MKTDSELLHDQETTTSKDEDQAANNDTEEHGENALVQEGADPGDFDPAVRRERRSAEDVQEEKRKTDPIDPANPDGK